MVGCTNQLGIEFCQTRLPSIVEHKNCVDHDSRKFLPLVKVYELLLMLFCGFVERVKMSLNQQRELKGKKAEALALCGVKAWAQAWSSVIS